MKKLCTLLILTSFAALAVKAQNGISEVIKSTPADATKLFGAFAEPIFKGFGIGLNTGWNNTAKTKGLFGIEVRVSATAAFVPSSKNSFDLSKLGLSNRTQPANASQTITPNIGGNSANGPVVNLYKSDGTTVLQSFNMPGGSGSVYGAPQVQVTVGMPFHTDVTLRAMPSIYYGNTLGNAGMLGLGVKHNIMEDFLGKESKLVPFDLAVTVDFTHVGYSLPLTVGPFRGATAQDSQQATDFTNQHFGGTFNSYIAGAVVSKKFLWYTVFASAYYSSSNTYMVLQGNYPFTTGLNSTGTPTYTTIANPINIDEKSISGLQADLGFQLNFALFRVYASYTLADYGAINAGVGVAL